MINPAELFAAKEARKDAENSLRFQERHVGLTYSRRPQKEARTWFDKFKAQGGEELQKHLTNV